MAGIITTNMMIELHHSSIATAKAEVPTKDDHMTGLAETGNGEATQEALEVLDLGLGLKTMEMWL